MVQKSASSAISVEKLKKVWADAWTPRLVKPCGNKKCKKSRRAKGLYCSDNCAAAVRMRRKYKRDKAGIRLKKCPACKGSGKVTR